MSDTQDHTREPWYLADDSITDDGIDGGWAGIYSEDLDTVIGRVESDDVGSFEAEANGKRLVACVNACVGMTVEQVKAIPALLARAESAEKLADGLKSELKVAIDDQDKHQKYFALSQANSRIGDGYWCWQGDGQDHLESLICPVLIRPEDLAAFIERAESAEKRLAEVEAISESRRLKLFQVGEERAAEWKRAENAEAKLATVEKERDGLRNVLAFYAAKNTWPEKALYDSGSHARESLVATCPDPKCSRDPK